jgi:hypothetical protein
MVDADVDHKVTTTLREKHMSMISFTSSNGLTFSVRETWHALLFDCLMHKLPAIYWVLPLLARGVIN